LLDARHAVGRLACRPGERVQVAPQRLDLSGLRVQTADGGGEGVDLRGQRLHLRLERLDRLLRFGQPGEAALEIRQRAAQVGNTLADELEAAAVELVALDGLAYLLASGRELRTDRAHLVVALLLEPVDLAGALHDQVVQRLEARHLLLELLERLRGLLLPLHALIDLPARLVETVGAGDGAIDGLALHLERGGLLRDVVAQRLERVDPLPDLLHGPLHAIQPAQRLLDRGDAALLVLEGARELLVSALERIGPRGRGLVRIHHPLEVILETCEQLARAVHSPAQVVRLIAELAERSLELEEAADLLLQLLGSIDLPVQLFEQRPDAFGVLRRVRDARFGLALALLQ